MNKPMKNCMSNRHVIKNVVPSLDSMIQSVCLICWAIIYFFRFLTVVINDYDSVKIKAAC